MTRVQSNRALFLYTLYALLLLTVCPAGAGWAQSPDDPASNASPGAAASTEAASEPAYRALLIVAEGYGRELGRLPNGCAQMRGVHDRLQMLGYHDIAMVSDYSRTPPTASGIRASLDRLVASTNPGDTLLVVVATHGVSVGGQSYICPLDHKSPRLSRRRFVESCVPVTEIYAALHRSGAKNVLLVLEACRTRVALPETSGADFVRDVGKGLPPGMLVFTSCSDTERSWTLPVRKAADQPPEMLSVFLHFMEQGLREADYSGGGNNGRLTASELYNYVAKGTARFTADAGQAQHPQVLGEVSSFVLGEYANTNRHLSMRLPIDEQFEFTLDMMAESGNAAVRTVKDRLAALPMESLYWMDNTSRARAIGGKKSVQMTKGERWYKVTTAADAQVADTAFDELYRIHDATLTQIRQRCFDVDLELRDSPRTRIYRANLSRLMGKYNAARYDYEKAGVDFEVFVPFSAKIYPERPGAGDATGASPRIGIASKEEEEAANTIADIARLIRQGRGVAPEDEEADAIPDSARIVRATVIDTAPYAADERLLFPVGENGSSGQDGDGSKPLWVQVEIRDLGRPFAGWVQVEDIFWSSMLAEVYWVSPDFFENYSRNYAMLAEQKVQQIHAAVHFYHNVASILSYAGIGGLPSIGGYVAQLEALIRGIVQRNIARRKSTARSRIHDYYSKNWWRPILEQEIRRHDRLEDASSMFEMGEAAQEGRDEDDRRRAAESMFLDR